MSAQELEAKNQKTIALLKQETTEQDKKLSELDKKLAEQDKRNAAVIQQLKEEIAAKQENEDQLKNEMNNIKFKQPKAVSCQIFWTVTRKVHRGWRFASGGQAQAQKKATRLWDGAASFSLSNNLNNEQQRRVEEDF